MACCANTRDEFCSQFSPFLHLLVECRLDLLIKLNPHTVQHWRPKEGNLLVFSIEHCLKQKLIQTSDCGTRIKYRLVALRTAHAHTHTCHLCEVELVAQPLGEAWSVWLPGCSLAPWKERLCPALADEDGSDISDKMGSTKSCRKVLLGQPMEPQSVSPLQPSWLGGKHQ